MNLEWLIPLIALTAMEIVLGIDNIIFIAILSARVRKQDRAKARSIGLIAALVMRVALLCAIWLVLALDEYSIVVLTDWGVPPTLLTDHVTGELNKHLNEFTVKDLVLLAGGLLMTTLIKQEVFPEFSLDMVTVSVSYPGATPEQVEQNIVLAIEEKVRDVSGIDEMTASAAEGGATVMLELSESADGQAVFQDVQQAVSQITTFPDDAEKPVISLSDHQRDVLDIQLYGDVSENALRSYAEEVRDRLLQSPDITQVELEGARDYVIRVAISQERLRSFGLTLGDVADTVAASAVDVAGGSADTASGEVLLRLKGRRDSASEFERIPLLTTPEGTVVRLGDVATVNNGFEDSKTEATYDGARSIGIGIYRVAKQTPISVSQATRKVMAELETDLPPSLHYAINGDSSEIYQQRLELLLKNAFMGLVLVLAVLILMFGEMAPVGSNLYCNLSYYDLSSVLICVGGGILPALALGFQPIPLERIGPRASFSDGA